MDLTWVIVIGIGLVALAVVLAAAKGGKGAGAFQVEPRRLMTERERHVIGMIEAAVPACRVHAQVSMGALMNAKRGLDRKRRTAIRNRFDRKIVDYVIEHRETGDVVALVELDDRTHNASKDEARDRLTADAGYTTIRLPAGKGVTHELVRERLAFIFAPADQSGIARQEARQL
ncbi:DUF2726 domain-containing protein (plasmid) [Croceicoccus marinus]|uniref:DUF2726 domain-containing protein n=2 Tax=Croceicoccus marinus TaxID=450378 RepID=A0A7G6VZM6_9SPHN|nr:DUF2726 domain-containing protein [Croceicoccus marinus]